MRKSVLVLVVGVVRAGGPEVGRVWAPHAGVETAVGAVIVSPEMGLGGLGHEGWTGFSVLAWGEVGQPECGSGAGGIPSPRSPHRPG